ncbi:MAG: pyridoxamine 5'-phosphate oxidase family protein [Xanthomonadales bacterium]|jgi:nitroimidazol reductase NimA-like FMN-containing flavoprotein (pyridoxamine 5'-phosphate oxidase superfamily)|nr:pyridoxamine 5'-phosphate oxidase family protein [Xanthomonadales bacterium]
MSSKADARLRRLPERGSSDFELACAIIDEAKVCHVGFTLAEQPYVVPMALGRDGERLLLHGSVVSRLMQNLADGLPCCVTVTHLDGMVLARSAFHSSMNYRSLMVFGRASEVTDPEAKTRGLDMLVDHLVPGRTAELRPSTRKELNATTLLTLPIETFSIKTRSGPPSDAASDLDAPVWAGVIPLKLTPGTPEDAPDLPQERDQIKGTGYI